MVKITVFGIIDQTSKVKSSSNNDSQGYLFRGTNIRHVYCKVKGRTQKPKAQSHVLFSKLIFRQTLDRT